MANNLYDTGAPQRVIVEHRHVQEVRVVHVVHEVVREVRDDEEPTRPKRKKKPVVITPQFEEVKERKALPPAKNVL